MREMIFNDVSVHIPVNSIHEVRPLLVDVSRGMASLVSKGVVNAVLRMTHSWDAYRCAHDGSLWDLLALMQHDRRELEEIRFLMRLGMKAPLLADLPGEVVDRFLGTEPATEDGVHGECLVLCAQMASIAISLPLQPTFDRDRVVVQFQEMMPDLTFNSVVEEVDNLARTQHAEAIAARNRIQLIQNLNFGNLWANRAVAFPNLTFGQDVEDQLTRLQAALINPVLTRLRELDDAAREWPDAKLPHRHGDQWCHLKVRAL